ncbi:MAG: hypothetical protein CVU54_10930 [Deltaproteobacteria bacterium HGW-Deltaproteobacteria-12]|nr:MAG: hypothetical protein CVU54_10930 [Deltaproteobacteria bacterium HGW-Deltaproteobacteria-12]
MCYGLDAYFRLLGRQERGDRKTREVKGREKLLFKRQLIFETYDSFEPVKERSAWKRTQSK